MTVNEEYKALSDDELDRVAGGVGQIVTYTVQRGDNLTKIAQKFGTTWRAICQMNSSLIKDPLIL